MKPGTRMFVIRDIVPAVDANMEVEVISFDEFKSGKPSSTARYHWKLDDIQRAVFVRLLEGPRKGTVDMMSKACLLKRRQS